MQVSFYFMLISKLIKGKLSHDKLFYLSYISPRLTEEYFKVIFYEEL